jgi:xanthine dehydrogenase accessory factor
VKNIYTHISDALNSEQELAIATIIETRGSTPQIPGTSALIVKGSVLKGTLGGGILEAEAQKRGKEALRQGASLLFDYHLDADVAAAEGALCGGIATVLIDVQPAKHRSVFMEMNRYIDKKIPGVLVTVIQKKADRVDVERFWCPEGSKFPPALSREPDVSSEVEKSLADRRTRIITIPCDPTSQSLPESIICFEPITPRPQLIIAGAGHIGQALAHLGSLLDFETTVIDDRQEFANAERLPDSDHILVADISQALNKLSITPDTYIVLVTRGHKHDADALKACIGSDAGYIGMIGSRRKVKQMRKEFIEKGWATPEQFDRIHAPIGMDISSTTIQEIAISIAAQLIQVCHQNRNLPHVTAIVLAAGESNRMKEPKLLLPYKEKSIIRTIVETIGQSKVHETVVVLGANREKIQEALEDSSVTFCTNRNYKKGMLSSLQTGLKSLPDHSDACMVFLGDQPMITPGIIDAIIDAYSRTQKGIVLPVFENRRGHPVLIGKKYIPDINAIDPKVGLRDLIWKFPDDIAEVGVDEEGIIRDIDTREDYEYELNKIKNA